MSKPAKAGYKPATPFVKTDRLKIKATEEGGRIVSFEVMIDGVLHVEHVKSNKVLDAFKKVEELTKKIVMELTSKYLKSIGFVYGILSVRGNTQCESMTNLAVTVCIDMPLPWPFYSLKKGKTYWCETIDDLEKVDGWNAQLKSGFDFRHAL